MDENRELSQQEMNGEFGRLFRISFHGFNRQDVVECIARLMRDRDREREEAQIRQRELEETRDLLNLDLAQAHKDAAELKARSYQAQAQMEAAQAELAQLKAQLQTRIDEVTQVLTQECACKDARIKTLEQEADLARQLLLAVRAENALLAQQAQVSAHAAAQYAIRMEAAAPSAHREKSSYARMQKLSSVLQRAERSSQPPAAAQPVSQAASNKMESASSAKSSGQMQAEKPPMNVSNMVQTGKANVQRRATVEKNWVGGLLAKLLND